MRYALIFVPGIVLSVAATMVWGLPLTWLFV